jgi:glycosyltransferase involved in cell wall biosynthesis
MRVGVLVLMAGREAGGLKPTRSRCCARSRASIAINEYVVYCTGGEAPPAIGIVQENVRYHVLRPGSRAVSVGVTLPAYLVRDGIDVLHSTFTPPPFVTRPEVLTLHCLSSFAHPEFYSPLIAWRLNGLLRLGMRRAACVLCVSQATAEDVHARFGVERERLAVSYNGVGGRFSSRAGDEARRRVRDTLDVVEPYALFVGKLEPRKNVTRLLQAFAQFKRDTGSQTTLLLAGHRTGVTPAIEQQIARLDLAGAVRQIGYVPGDLLTSLYSAARMFLFPSLWEGFGIPIVEAMACGTPVLTSNVTCLPEIAGDAAVIVNPQSTESIADGIARLDRSDKLREALVARGFERARLFTWENCARETLNAYQRVTEH